MVERIIGSFLCEKNKDIDFFLKKKALLFQRKNKAKTYFILDEDELNRGIFNILGYFALSTKVLHLPEELSKNQRKKIDGLYTSVSEISTFLIGQIAKNDYNNSKITGDEILKYACYYILQASSIIGGRIVLVELVNNSKLIDFYNKNDFILLPNKTENEEKLLQMIKII